MPHLPLAVAAETQLLETAADPTNRCQVVRWLRTFPFAFLSQREYVIARRFFREGDNLYAVTRGLVEHPAAPRVPGQVRMEDFYRCAQPLSTGGEGFGGPLGGTAGAELRRLPGCQRPGEGYPKGAWSSIACQSRDAVNSQQRPSGCGVIPILYMPPPPCFCSCWRSRTVPCPHGSDRPAVETTLLHFEDFRINERLARCAAAAACAAQ